MKYRINIVFSLMLMLSVFLIPSLAQTADDLVVLYVSSETVECTGVGLQTCLQIKQTPNDEWELHYDGIVNFQHELGVEYTLLVRRVETDPNIADAPSFRYQLVRIVNRSIVGDDSFPLSSFYEPTEEWLILSVASEMVDCVGMLPTTCLQVKSSLDAEWELLFDGIFDFAHQSGYEYELLVQKADLYDGNLTDVPSFTYHLEHIISKTPIDSELEMPMTLDGTRWTLHHYLVDDAVGPLVDGTEITLEFVDGQISGSAGCNSYFGDYQQDGNQLTFGIIGATRMACEESIMQQETSYLQALEAVTSFTIEGDTLKIEIGAETFMIFDPIQSATEVPMELAGTSWTLQGYQVDDAIGLIMDGTEITLEFTSDGVAGSAGCNNYFGDYQQSDNQLTFGMLASTEMACEQSIMQQEQSYFEALASATSFTIEAGTLKIEIGAESYMLFDPRENR